MKTDVLRVSGEKGLGKVTVGTASEGSSAASECRQQWPLAVRPLLGVWPQEHLHGTGGRPDPAAASVVTAKTGNRQEGAS